MLPVRHAGAGGLAAAHLIFRQGRCRARNSWVLQVRSGVEIPRRAEGFAHGPKPRSRVRNSGHRPCKPSPGHQSPGPGLVDGHLQVGIALIVAEDDVVTGTILLDQGGLQQERLLFGGGEDGFDRGGPGEQGLGLGLPGAGGVAVGGQAGPEVDRLADVEDFALPVPHQVNPGGAGNGLQKFRDSGAWKSKAKLKRQKCKI